MLLWFLSSCGLWISDADLCSEDANRVWFHADADGDGYGDPASKGQCQPGEGLVGNADDCDDTDASITTAELMGEIPGLSVWYQDADNDGYGLAGTKLHTCDPPESHGAFQAGDCADDNPRFSLVCPWESVAVGHTSACGLRIDGMVECWGTDTVGDVTGAPASAASLDGEWSARCRLDEEGRVQLWGGRWSDGTMDDEVPGRAGNVGVSCNFMQVCVWDAEGSMVCRGQFADGEFQSTSEGAPKKRIEHADVSQFHGCALRTDGEVTCWGQDTHGQVSQTPTRAEYTAVAVGDTFSCAAHESRGVDCWGRISGAPTAGRFVQLFAGATGACAIDEEGALVCWGGAPADLPMGTWSSGSLSENAGCVLDAEGDIACWGDAGFGQLSPPSGGFEALWSGGNGSCARHEGGALTCWGDTSDASGDGVALTASHGGACVVRGSGELDCWGTSRLGDFPGGDTVPQVDPAFVDVDMSSRGPFGAAGVICGVTHDGEYACLNDLTGSHAGGPQGLDVVQVAPGNGWGCVRDAAGSLHCWGDPPNDSAGAPLNDAPTEAGFVDVSVTWTHGCAVHEDGRLVCWGDDSWGDPSGWGGWTYAVSTAPTDPDILKVDTFYDHNCVVHAAGHLTCWGTGDGQFEILSPDGAPFADVSVDRAGVCALTTDGQTRCWGGDLSEVDQLSGIAAVEAGEDTGCVLTELGDVWCAGGADESELARGPDGLSSFTSLALGAGRLCVAGEVNTSCMGTPFAGATAPDEPLSGLVVGGGHACGLDSQGLAHCWGDDSVGQASPPTTPFASLSAGSRHTCGLDGSGGVHCWGDIEAPPADGGFTALASGRDHACAIDADGVRCWGDNSFGQAEPVDGRFTSVAAGSYFTCALDDAGVATCWGEDSHRQVRDTPPYVLTQITTGAEHACGLKLDGFLYCWGRDLEGQTAPPNPVPQ